MRIAWTYTSSRVTNIALHEPCELLREALRATNDMVLLGLGWHRISKIECVTSHADAGLSPLYGGELQCIGFATSSGEPNFTCTVLKFSLRSSRKGAWYNMRIVKM